MYNMYYNVKRLRILNLCVLLFGALIIGSKNLDVDNPREKHKVRNYILIKLKQTLQQGTFNKVLDAKGK